MGGSGSLKRPKRSHTEDPFAGNLSDRRRGPLSEVLPKNKKDKKKKSKKRDSESRSQSRSRSHNNTDKNKTAKRSKTTFNTIKVINFGP